MIASFAPRRGEMAEMVRLAFPVAVVQVGMMAMGVADTIMVGHVSARDLAAVALGHLYFFAITIVGVGILMALDPIVSQGVGARDRLQVARGLQRGIVLAGLLTVASSVLFLPVQPLLGVLRQPEDVVPVAAGYALASVPGLFPFFFYVVLRQTLQAMGRVAPLVLAIVLANGVNLFFNWVFIYGNLGVPALGAVGSGWASSLSRWLMAGGLVALSWRVLRPYVRPFRADATAIRPLLRMTALGLPIGFQFFLEFGAFAVIGVLMGWLGTVAMAGHQVAINLASLTFMVPLGVSQAASILVGRAVGRGDAPRARRFAGAGLLLGGLFMTLAAAIFLVVPDSLARFYSDDPEVVRLAILLLPIAGIFQVFDGLQVVAAGVLRGVADTRSPLVVNLLGFWMVGMPVSVYLGFRAGAGAVGLWWGLAAGLAAVAAFLLARVRVRLGRGLLRVVMDRGPADSEGAPAGTVAD